MGVGCTTVGVVMYCITKSKVGQDDSAGEKRKVKTPNSKGEPVE